MLKAVLLDQDTTTDEVGSDATHDVKHTDELCRSLGSRSSFPAQALVDDADEPLFASAAINIAQSKSFEANSRRRGKSTQTLPPNLSRPKLGPNPSS
jgi:hypothetical protein